SDCTLRSYRAGQQGTAVRCVRNHSITSLAPINRDGDTFSPSALAVLILITVATRAGPPHPTSELRTLPTVGVWGCAEGLKWSRLSEQIFLLDKWSFCLGWVAQAKGAAT